MICFLIWLFRSLASEILPSIAFHELLQVQLPIIVLVNSLENVNYFSWKVENGFFPLLHLGKTKRNLLVATCPAHFENLLGALPCACNGLWVPILVVPDHTFKHFSMLHFGRQCSSPGLTPSMLSRVSMMTHISSISITPLLSISYNRKDHRSFSSSDDGRPMWLSPPRFSHLWFCLLRRWP